MRHIVSVSLGVPILKSLGLASNIKPNVSVSVSNIKVSFYKLMFNCYVTLPDLISKSYTALCAVHLVSFQFVMSDTDLSVSHIFNLKVTN